MAPNVIDDPSTISWLKSRKKNSDNLRDATLSGDTQRWLEERRALPFYSSLSPHTCKHCRDITIELAESGKGSRLRLPYGLAESILAAKEGCPIYQNIVDLVFNFRAEVRKRVPENPVFSFWLRYRPEVLPDETAQLEFEVDVVSAETGAEEAIDGDNGFTVWALEGNPAAAPISVRPYQLDYMSTSSAVWGKNCIEYCRLDHSECSGLLGDDGSKEVINPDSIPSRLLMLYQNEDGTLHAQIIGRDMKNQVPTPDVSRRGFAILSYCWGGPQPITLTSKSSKELGQGFPVTILPKTLADAALFTHKLGLEYLWIDALCIFQDDDGDNLDKGREIPQMGQYYGDATVTLCAASASTCSSGLQTTPLAAEDPANYLFGPIQLRARTSAGEIGTIQVLKEADYFSSHREREPIVRRGWTLQESLLSRRILIFSSHHLYFSCKVGNASCGGREPLPKSRVIGVYESRVPGVNTISSLQRMYPVVSTWDKVVNEYTQRLLGFPGDKLLAISAMAASLVRMAKDERGLVYRYCAGLMFDLEGKDWGWKGELLWAVTQPATPLGATGLTRTPSWSWASVQAPVHRWSASTSNFPEDGIRLLDLHAPLADERNPFGAVKGGFVKLVARTRSFSTVNESEIHIIITRNTILDDDMYDESSRSALVVRPDTMQVDDMIASGGGGVVMVELIATRRNGKLLPTYPAGILVINPGTNSKGEAPYQRVGIFEVKFKDLSSSDAHREAALKQAQALFDNRDLQELYIV
ncbi:HET-domain-containing protein [Nemania sp. FL0031]|nr:HET-domain-containing protein [Nemania sp. FL0031]